MKCIGIVIADRGAAVVSVERSPDAALVVTAIERLPSDLGPVAECVRALDAENEPAVKAVLANQLASGNQPETRFIVDAEGLGSALWAVLRPGKAKRWTLYTGRGFDRQALVDELLVAMQENRFHFAAGLAEQEAMSKALLSYRRQVREDGVIGSELVVALLLALIPPPVVYIRKPRHAWGF